MHTNKIFIIETNYRKQRKFFKRLKLGIDNEIFLNI